jgi:hypothetical protein
MRVAQLLKLSGPVGFSLVLSASAQTHRWTFAEDGELQRVDSRGYVSFKRGGRFDGDFAQIGGDTNIVLRSRTDGLFYSTSLTNLSTNDREYLGRKLKGVWQVEDPALQQEIASQAKATAQKQANEKGERYRQPASPRQAASPEAAWGPSPSLAVWYGNTTPGYYQGQARYFQSAQVNRQGQQNTGQATGQQANPVPQMMYQLGSAVHEAAVRTGGPLPQAELARIQNQAAEKAVSMGMGGSAMEPGTLLNGYYQNLVREAQAQQAQLHYQLQQDDMRFQQWRQWQAPPASQPMPAGSVRR